MRLAQQQQPQQHLPFAQTLYLGPSRIIRRTMLMVAAPRRLCASTPQSYNVGWEKHRRTKHNILRHYETIDFNVFFTKNAKDTICFYKFSTYINKFLMFPYLPTYKQ